VLFRSKDASWVTDNCELVSFLQYDGTKEIFQGTKIALNNLQPMPALARFTASSTLPCINNDVDFYDNSLGQIISWNWTFEGGNPPTSTLQDPVVTYATPGQYDVQLIVYDGDVYDTMLTTNYIEAITIPPQPSTPIGETELCQGTGDVVYTTTALPHATSYLWQVSPSTAGTITGTGTEGTFSLDQGYLGSFTVRVRADNDCGTGTFSQNLNVTAYYSPFEYTLSDGGGYCEGGEGIEVTQDGSEADVNYELFVNGISTGQTLPGTGSPLDFGLQTTEGIYTCTGSNDHCTTGMIGNTYIFVIHQVGTTAAPGGSAMECNYNVGTPYNTAGAPHATYYIWTLNPAEAGTINGSTSTATVDWNTSYTGMASINVQGANSCGVGIVSPDLDVYVYAAPQPEISGESSVCNNDLGVLYSTPENTGSNYEWQISGGTIASGAGTHEVSVNWGAPGSGYLAVTELTAQGCSSTTDNFDVTIEDCTGIGELANMPWRIFPNPVNGLLNIEVGLQKDQVLQVNILNLLGQSVYQLAGLTGNGLKKIQVNTTGFKEGVYTVQIRSANGSVVEKKFVKLD
jgi:PKD repeat protein